MAFTHTTTGMTGRGTIVRGDVAWVSGTWASKSVSAGTIVTGGSLVLCHDVSVGSALITGGTGFLGKHLTKEILKYDPQSIRIFSRDEVKHHTANYNTQELISK